MFYCTQIFLASQVYLVIGCSLLKNTEDNSTLAVSSYHLPHIALLNSTRVDGYRLLYNAIQLVLHGLTKGHYHLQYKHLTYTASNNVPVWPCKTTIQLTSQLWNDELGNGLLLLIVNTQQYSHLLVVCWLEHYLTDVKQPSHSTSVDWLADLAAMYIWSTEFAKMTIYRSVLKHKFSYLANYIPTSIKRKIQVNLLQFTNFAKIFSFLNFVWYGVYSKVNSIDSASAKN